MLQVAEAPRMHHKLAALTDLDKDQSWVPAGAGADIDLSLLTSCLLPLDQVRIHEQPMADGAAALVTVQAMVGRI